MATCYQCGAELPDGVEFCPYCGMAVVPETVPVAAGVAAGGAGLASVLGSASPSSGAVSGPRLITPALPASGAGLPRRGLSRPSRRTLLVAGVVAAVLITGGIGYAVFKPAGPSATASVQRFFDDLAKGDTTSALKLVADAEQLTGVDYPLLTAEALADQANRPTGLRVLDAETPGQSRTNLSLVRVSYQVGGATVDQTIEAHQPRVRNSCSPTRSCGLSIGETAGRPVTVNGVALSSDEINTFAFPGVVRGDRPGQRAVPRGHRKGHDTYELDWACLDARIAFGETSSPQAHRTPSSRKARVHRRLREQSTCLNPDNCPFSVWMWMYGRDASSKWEITTYPTITVQVSGSASSGSQVAIHGTGGVVHYTDATYPGLLGDHQTESGDQDFGIRGKASAQGSTITVTVN